ncbi:hypothetical protein Goshw_020341 [Gossypium schwendimanii]|uniref:Uncharacterized protein n=1 Tax=Gossypium schwendimanii TaxID=34291 RepID=A0A7J9NFH2_GOSSC|nr:hypothetical protein [Gossypium schwendimanii]
MENLWFMEPYNSNTMRFTFDAKSIAELKAIAKDELEAMPSRIQAVLGFIWKRSMAASRMISGSFKPSVLAQDVSLRPRMNSNLLQNSIENLICHDYDHEYLNALQGEKGFEIISEYINHLETMFSIEKRDAFPQQVGSTSSITSSIFIENGSEFNNNVVLLKQSVAKALKLG